MKQPIKKSRVATRDFCAKVRFVFRSFVYLHKNFDIWKSYMIST